jgi:transposase
MAYTIGIDVCKLRLDCACRRGADQVKSKRKSFKNDPDHFGSLLTWAENLAGTDCQDIVFIVEPTSVYHEQLVEFLHESGGTAYLVNPGKVRKFAEGIGILSKNDVIDADLLSQYGLMAKKLIPFEPLPREVSSLRSLLNRLNTLERNLRRELNRQEKVGKTSVFHKLEEQSIERFVKHHKTEIKRFKKFIREMIKKSSPLQENYELLMTIPGVGEKTAWIMLIILKSRTFSSAQEVASFLGLNPIEKRSGTTEYRRPRLSKAGNGFFRQALFFPAMVATSKNPDIKAQYERLLANGKSKMCANGAAMRKLVHICYGVLKNQRPYEVQIQNV